MPTGYTADVATGKMIDFREYALQCARAFGACIILRDEPLSAQIPTFEPSQFNLKEARRLEKELSEFLAMSEEKRREVWKSDYVHRLKERSRWLAEIESQRQRYECMLAKAKAFKSPSPDHDKYAKFLVSQLEDSIKFDCDVSFYEKSVELPPFEDWESDYIKGMEKDIRRHKVAYREEVERTNSRNQWVEVLKKALEESSTGGESS